MGYKIVVKRVIPFYGLVLLLSAVACDGGRSNQGAKVPAPTPHGPAPKGPAPKGPAPKGSQSPNGPQAPDGTCYERVIQWTACSGVAYAPGQGPPPQPRRVCDLCETDGHCTAQDGGRCMMMPGNTCHPSLRVCVYPGNICLEPNACSQQQPGHRCMHHAGKALCGRQADPPP